MILDNLRVAGVQQARKTDRISFHIDDTVAGRDGVRRRTLSARATATRRRGPPSSSVRSSAPSLGQTWYKAAREAGDAAFDVLIACAFNYEAHASNSASSVASPS